MESEQIHPLDPEIYQRNELILDDSHQEESTILRFMTWNVLANGYKSSFPTVPEPYFNEEYRYNLMIQEILANSIEINGVKSVPDIVCLQEVNMAEELIDILNKSKSDDYLDFEYRYENIVFTNEKKFGCYILYDSTKYKVITSKIDYFRGPLGDNLMDRGYVICLFEHSDTKKKICVCTTHLDADKKSDK